MDSLDAQCLLMQTVEGQIHPPDIWRHYRSGALSCAYNGGESVFTWPAQDVAKMGRRWRDSGTSRDVGRTHRLADTHRRLAALVREAGLGPPDTVVHDLGRAELRAVWEDEEIVLVVEEIGKGAPASSDGSEESRQSFAPPNSDSIATCRNAADRADNEESPP